MAAWWTQWHICQMCQIFFYSIWEGRGKLNTFHTHVHQHQIKSAESDGNAKCSVHIHAHKPDVVLTYTILNMQQMQQKGNVYCFSLFSCQEMDFSSTEETKTSKIKKSCLTKSLLASLILKDISLSYTPLCPPPVIWAHPSQPHCIALSRRELPTIPAQLLIK